MTAAAVSFVLSFSNLLGEREIGGFKRGSLTLYILKIRLSTIENRLLLLDQAGDNDYFKIPYGGYMFEEWGKGI
jgi:hypothetical protein